MRLTKSFAFAVSALALSTSAAFAGGDPMSAQDQRAYEQSQFLAYEQGGPETLSEAELAGALEREHNGSAAFSSEAPLTDQSDPMGYQPFAYRSYEQGGPDVLSSMQPPDYVYDVYIVPADAIVLMPLEEPSEVPISGNELG
jgi:hypothetical protein